MPPHVDYIYMDHHHPKRKTTNKTNITTAVAYGQTPRNQQKKYPHNKYFGLLSLFAGTTTTTTATKRQ